MPLVFSGQQGASPQFEIMLEAHDGKARVVVVTSSEALQDHGIERIRQKASQKYDAGQCDPNGRVIVFTTDFYIAPTVRNPLVR